MSGTLIRWSWKTERGQDENSEGATRGSYRTLNAFQESIQCKCESGMKQPRSPAFGWLHGIAIFNL